MKRLTIAALLLVAALFTGGCLQTLAAGLAGGSQPEVWDVVPGASAGPIKIGMKSIDVHRALGVPSESKTGMREVWEYRKDLAVAFDAESKVMGVQMIRAGRVQWKGRTLDGTATGKDAVSVFGDPDFVSHWTREKDDSVQYIVYGYRALGFGVLADPRTDRVVGYIVTAPEEPVAAPPAPGTQTPTPP